MEKTNEPKIDERAVKIALDRLAREIKNKSGLAPAMYLTGYHEAIADFIWDYTRQPLKSLDWDRETLKMHKEGKVKLAMIKIDDINMGENNERRGKKKQA